MIDLQEKAILSKIFPNYNPKRHDAFKIAYVKWADKHNLWAYHKERGITPLEPEPMPIDFEPIA